MQKLAFQRKYKKFGRPNYRFFKWTQEDVFFWKVYKVLVGFVFQENMKNFGWAKNLGGPGFGALGSTIYNYCYVLLVLK